MSSMRVCLICTCCFFPGIIMLTGGIILWFTSTTQTEGQVINILPPCNLNVSYTVGGKQYYKFVSNHESNCPYAIKQVFRICYTHTSPSQTDNVCDSGLKIGITLLGLGSFTLLIAIICSCVIYFQPDTNTNTTPKCPPRPSPQQNEIVVHVQPNTHLAIGRNSFIQVVVENPS